MASQTDVVSVAWYRGDLLLNGEEPLAVVQPAGLECRITVPPGALLLGAELTLRAPSSDTQLVLRALGPASPDTVALPLGAVSRSAASAEQSWLTIDLGARRTLVALRVKGAGVNAAVRLKLADGAGPFFAASPVDVVALSADFIALPEMTASRLLLELGTLTTPGKVFAAAAAVVELVDIQVAAGPPDLSVQVGSAPPFFRDPLPLPKTQPLVLREELLAALGRAWPTDLTGGTVTLSLRASAPGRIGFPLFALRTATVVRAFSGAAATVELPIRWDAVNKLSVDLPPVGTTTLQFRVAAELRREQPLITRSPANVTLRCARGSLAALGFPALPAAASLAAVDLCLVPLTSGVRGKVALHADRSGQPDPLPLPGATAQFALEAAEIPPWDARWLRIELPTPFLLPPQTVCWVVVTVSDGVALWGLASRPADPAGSEVGSVAVGWALCTGGNPWRPVSSPDSPPAEAPWAGCRLHQSTHAPPLPRLTLHGAAAVEVTADAQGLVALGPEQLDALLTPRAQQAPPASQLTLQVDAPVDGAVTLSDLWIQLPELSL